jgi:TonB family protein
VIAFALVLLLAAAPDTLTRVPGTSLRFGASFASVEARGFQQPGAVAGVALNGPCRIFGLEGQAKLTFEDGSLSHAAFDVANASPVETDYLEDELRRQGYHRSCRTLTDEVRDCDWSGRADVTVKITGTTVHVDAKRAVRGEKRAAGAPGVPAAIAVTKTDSGAPMERSPRPEDALPETLSVARSPLRSRFASIAATTEGAAPFYPEAAVRAGIQGRIWVYALIDAEGRVTGTTVERGIPELNAPAMAAARSWRFAPHHRNGQPMPYVVEIPVTFRLH